MEVRFFPESGFVARGEGPRRDAPRDWFVWHFTHADNLEAIVEAGRLLPDDSVAPSTNVGSSQVKARRRSRQVCPDPAYPVAPVSAHVPFYIAAKSPMLYVVTRGHEDYGGGDRDLVFLGVLLGDIVDSGLTWCASDGNCAAAFTNYSRTLDTLGQFVDFDVLCQRDWYNTPDDMNRKSRRAAEVLVRDSLPLELATIVVAKSQAVCEGARRVLGSVGGKRQYWVLPEFYY